MPHEDPDFEQNVVAPYSWMRRVDWPLLIVLGLLVYEVAALQVIGAMVACSKLGWQDLRTAFWLRRRDTDAQRGWTYFWLYVTWALNKIVISAFLVTLALSSIGGDGGPWMSALAQVIIGLLFLVVSASVTIGRALRHGTILWLSPDMHRARRADEWPPTPYLQERMNRAKLLLVPTALLAIVVAIFFLAGITELFWPNPGDVKAICMLVGIVILLFGPGWFVCSLIERLCLSRPDWAFDAPPEGCSTEGLLEN
jgi:hypothetical protein